jgi:glyoxylate reductase
VNKVLITRRLPAPVDSLLAQAGCAVDLIDSEAAPERAELLRRLSGCAAVLATATERIDGEALEAAGTGLRVVANCAVGYDNIDVLLCRRRGVVVTNTPDVLTEATADLAWALILATARRVVEGDRWVRSGAWPGWAPSQLLGVELCGATLGIVGAGRIGTAVARRSAGFGMAVRYAHPRAAPELERALGAQRLSLDELLRASDIVSLHVPFREENRRMIGARELGLMRPGALLINTARGALVDEAALVQALRSGRIRAGLDVYEAEPRLAPGLAELPNTVLLPHLGSATLVTRTRMARMAAENIIAVLAGRPPLNPVG